MMRTKAEEREENLEPQDSRFFSIMFLYYMACILGDLKKIYTSATEAPLAVVMRTNACAEEGQHRGL
jgi:hypothetical protein